jgi:uncharacterized phage-like protein YoqJ
MIIAGTGHRPHMLPCEYREWDPWCLDIKESLLEALYEDKPEAVISGGAQGWDTWLAEAAISLKIPLWLYLPFKGTGNNWSNAAQNRLVKIIAAASKITYQQGEYSDQCFLERDKSMVNDCTFVYALLNPEVKKGGTFYTVNYAKFCHKPIRNFWYNDSVKIHTKI